MRSEAAALILALLAGTAEADMLDASEAAVLPRLVDRPCPRPAPHATFRP
jgi:hypothetical protein